MAEQPSQHARHLIRVRVSAEFLFALMRTSKPRVISCEGVPEDAKVFRIANDGIANCVWVFYEHPSFPLVEDGSLVEEFCPVWTTYHGPHAHEVLDELAERGCNAVRLPVTALKGPRCRQTIATVAI